MRSVLDQNLLPGELIVVDDCSDDQVAGLEPPESTNGLKVIFYCLPVRSGAPIARNTGASLASGDILMFLDDDDVWESGKIRDQMGLFEQYPDVGLVYTGQLFIDDTADGRVMQRSRNHHSGRAWPDILFRNFVGPTSAVAVRANLFRQVGGFDPQLAALQDYDLWLRLSQIARVMYDGKYNLRFTSISLSKDRISSNIDKYILAFSYIMRKYCSELAQLPKADVARMLAQSHIVIGGKFLHAGNKFMFCVHMARSILIYPRIVGRLFSAVVSRIVVAMGIGVSPRKKRG